MLKDDKNVKGAFEFQRNGLRESLDYFEETQIEQYFDSLKARNLLKCPQRYCV